MQQRRQLNRFFVAQPNTMSIYACVAPTTIRKPPRVSPHHKPQAALPCFTFRQPSPISRVFAFLLKSLTLPSVLYFWIKLISRCSLDSLNTRDASTGSQFACVQKRVSLGAKIDIEKSWRMTRSDRDVP
uniref:Uncharacterized protein n=1 Tax=Cucumis melo TaxID=3656 RepID=A0A9I9EC14_CUCME